MRVILCNRYYFPDESASSRLVTSLARGLARDGNEVHVIAGAARHDDPSAPAPAGGDGEVRVHRLRGAGLRRGGVLGRALDDVLFMLAFIWRCARLARRGDVVIVCTDPPLLAVAAMIASPGAIRINWLFDLYPEIAVALGVARERSPLIRLVYALRDAALRAAALNVTPMQSMADHLRGRGVPAERLTALHSWSEGAAIKPTPHAGNRLRRRWGVEDVCVVGYSGNFGRAHDFDAILDAAARLNGHGEVAFVFVGGGYRNAEVERRASELELRNVRFLPLQPRERLAETLCAIDLHLVSLRPEMERFMIPSKFYGIAAAGRPTIFVGDRQGEIARILARHACGIAVAPDGGACLAKQILALAHDPERRARMGEAARAAFEAEFDERAGLDAWRRILARLTAKAALVRPALPAGAHP